MRLEYEIGARGTDEQTEKFIRTIKEEFSGSYFTGRYYEETVKSVLGRSWDDISELQPRLMGWCVEWSRRFPEVEIFYTLKARAGYGNDELLYATFEKGEFATGQTIVQHDRFVELLGDCECHVRLTFFEKYPLDTPFVDCPVRLNPPTAWAVENIMEAHERIGVRR